MINPRELAKGPNRPLTEPTPIFTKDQLIWHLRSLINYVVQNNPLKSVAEALERDYTLFEMTAEDDFSYAVDPNGKVVGKADKDTFQKVTFEVMGDYGIDLDHPLGTNTHFLKDGTLIESIRYKGKNRSLIFEQILHRYKDSDRKISVRWTVNYHPPFSAKE